MYSIINCLGSGAKSLLVSPDPLLPYLQLPSQSHQLVLTLTLHAPTPISLLIAAHDSFPVVWLLTGLLTIHLEC